MVGPCPQGVLNLVIGVKGTRDYDEKIKGVSGAPQKRNKTKATFGGFPLSVGLAAICSSDSRGLLLSSLVTAERGCCLRHRSRRGREGGGGRRRGQCRGSAQPPRGPSDNLGRSGRRHGWRSTSASASVSLQLVWVPRRDLTAPPRPGALCGFVPFSEFDHSVSSEAQSSVCPNGVGGGSRARPASSC